MKTTTMVRIILTSLLGALFLASPNAFASGWFIEGGYSAMRIDNEEEEYTPRNGFFLGGFSFNQFLDIVAERNITISSDNSIDLNNKDIDANITAGYLRGKIPLTPRTLIYGKAGYADLELSDSFFFFSVSEEKTHGLMYGMGSEFNLNSNGVFLGLDYTRYHDEGKIDASAFNIGIGKRF